MTRANELSARLERLEDIALNESRTSSLTSPTPLTTQTLSLDVLEMMMTKMTEMFREERRETREMVLDILQGRQHLQTGTTEIASTENGQQTSYDAELTPLPAELQAVIDRETSETLELQALLRERETLQRRAMMLEEEMRKFPSSPDSSPNDLEQSTPAWTEDESDLL